MKRKHTGRNSAGLRSCCFPNKLSAFNPLFLVSCLSVNPEDRVQQELKLGSSIWPYQCCFCNRRRVKDKSSHIFWVAIESGGNNNSRRFPLEMSGFRGNPQAIMELRSSSTPARGPRSPISAWHGGWQSLPGCCRSSANLSPLSLALPPGCPWTCFFLHGLCAHMLQLVSSLQPCPLGWTLDPSSQPCLRSCPRPILL